MKITKLKLFSSHYLPFILGLIILICLLNSCVTPKQEARILKKCVTSSYSKEKDSIKETNTSSFTPSVISVSGPTVYLKNPCDSTGKIKDFKTESSKNGIKQGISSKNGVIKQWCNADSLLLIIETQKQVIEKFSIKDTKEQVHENCKLIHRTSLDVFCRWFTCVTIVLILLSIIIYLLYLRFKKLLK